MGVFADRCNRLCRMLFLWLFASLFVLGDPLSVVPQESSSAKFNIIIRQNGLSWNILPLVGSAAPADFYGYANFQSKNFLVQADTSLIFFYREARGEGTLSLFFIHGSPSRVSSGQGAADFSFFGLPSTTFLLLRDDPDDVYWLSPPLGNIHWRWSAGFTDGAILGGLAGEFTLTIFPRFDSGITRWVLATGEPDNPQFIELPSTQQPLVLQVRPADPRASFSHMPENPVVGELVSFDASTSRSTAGPIMRYRWDFDHDGIFELVSAVPLLSHAFPTSGDHAVTLQVEDVLGRVARTTRTVRVRENPVRVTRGIRTWLPDFQALRGYSFRVELHIEADVTVNGIGIAEVPPLGWSLKPLENGGAQFNKETSEWLFVETLPAGSRRHIRYQVDVPAGEQPGSYQFVGRVLSGLPQTSSAIGGDSQVHVISALSIELAISRLNEDGEIDLTLSNVISFSQILQAVALWQEQQPVPGTNGRRLDLSTMVRLVAYWLTDTPVNRPLPSGSP